MSTNQPTKLRAFECTACDYARAGNWYGRYVPTDDLVNIYTELYGRSSLITGDVINHCTLLLYLERYRTYHVISGVGVRLKVGG